MERNDIAQLVLDAACPREVKRISGQLKSPKHSTRLAGWDTIQVYVVAFILKVYLNQYAKFMPLSPQKE